MNEKLVIVLPMAGWGTRMRPHTWNKPKALCRVAGLTTLDYILFQFAPVHQFYTQVQYVFILSSHDHQHQIEEHIQHYHASLDIQYVQQTIMNGQSTAIKLTEQFLQGPMILAFADTLIDIDFSVIQQHPEVALAWGVQVNQPEHYGVAHVDDNGMVDRIKEKPQQYIGNLAMVGTYYFPRGEQLISGIDRQIERRIHKDEDDPADAQSNEFYIVPTINILIKEDHLPVRVVEAPGMNDAGRPDAILETNAYLLNKYRQEEQQTYSARFENDVVLQPPLFIGDNVVLKNVILGPNVSVGANTVIEDAEISHSIIGEDCTVTRLRMKNSLLGDRVKIIDTKNSVRSFNLGDDSVSVLEHGGDKPPQLLVECQSSAAYAERPVALQWSGERLEIDAIMSRWRTQFGRGFRVRTIDARQFTLFYDESSDQWQVDLFLDRTD